MRTRLLLSRSRCDRGWILALQYWTPRFARSLPPDDRLYRTFERARSKVLASHQEPETDVITEVFVDRPVHALLRITPEKRRSNQQFATPILFTASGRPPRMFAWEVAIFRDKYREIDHSKSEWHQRISRIRARVAENFPKRRSNRPQAHVLARSYAHFRVFLRANLRCECECECALQVRGTTGSWLPHPWRNFIAPRVG